jgi:hypothetical protein
MGVNQTGMDKALLLKISLSAQQQQAFTACAEVCGLDLATWVVQCAAVQAAAVIDAMQASQRGQRQSRKKPRDCSRTRRIMTESTTMEAARSYNARFRARAKSP